MYIHKYWRKVMWLQSRKMSKEFGFKYWTEKTKKCEKQCHGRKDSLCQQFQEDMRQNFRERNYSELDLYCVFSFQHVPRQFTANELFWKSGHYWYPAIWNSMLYKRQDKRPVLWLRFLIFGASWIEHNGLSTKQRQNSYRCISLSLGYACRDKARGSKEVQKLRI